MKKKTNGKPDKLVALKSQMKDMSQNYQDMIKARAEAKKQLEARFQTVYDQIEENKQFTINEGNRVMAKLNAFQETFENRLISTKETIKNEIMTENNFVVNKLKEINSKIDDLDKELEEEKQERIKQEEMDLAPIRQDIEGIFTLINRPKDSI